MSNKPLELSHHSFYSLRDNNFLDLWWHFNNLRYADDTTLMEESEEELKSLLMKVKEESENTKIMVSSPIIHGK